MNTLKKIIFDWVFPGFLVIKKILKFVPFIWILIIFYPKYYVEIWDFGWYCLLLIVFSRPLRDVLPKLGILKKIVALRKEIWIISWIFITAHWLWFFLNSKISLLVWLTSLDFYNLTNLFGWWMIWMYIWIILTLTSNKFSQKFLGKNWKRLQRLTYLFFIFGAIHIAFVDTEKILPLSTVVSSWAILWILAYKKIILWKNK
jgi:DMSO/TMAO reductase YedYZ heme-binding membrane subunit